MKYKQFLKRKSVTDQQAGFAFKEAQLNQKLFDYQRVITAWALARGRAAIFADTGLGKTAMQCEWAQRVHDYTDGQILIVAPLCVAQQTVTEAAKFGIDVEYVREPIDAPITITNYEMLDRFDMGRYEGIVLDESSILKAHDGKTRTKIIEVAQTVPYRLSCTATPSPNDFMELGNQAEFLGVMTRMEMLAMFFVHDGGQTSQWRLKGHGERKFWEWLSTWAVVVRKPSDLGFSDEGFDLPLLRVHKHILDSAVPEGELFARPAVSLSEVRASKRASMGDRVRSCAELVNRSDESWLVWCHLNDESSALGNSIAEAETVSGSDAIKEKEKRITGFTDGWVRTLITKPSIAGFGMNWQHCHHVAFVGLDHSFEKYYQAIRRCWRFGQKHPVDVHVFLSESELSVLEIIEAKERQHKEMSERMVEHMREFMKQRVFGMKRDRAEYKTTTVERNNWMLHLGDAVEVCDSMGETSIDYTIFSPPFASLYTYSNSDRDMGNCKDDEEFRHHFRYLVDQLYRVTKPGRLLSFHCMNLPTSKQNHGYIGVRDFRGDMIRLFEGAGWIFHSEVCIWKDPVTAMQRTKALGLLHKQLKKDAAMARQGIPDYLVTMRKPGENPEPVTNTNESFPVHVWQNYASPVWMDINPNNTLNFRAARENQDERHICPLQLDVIERAVSLWTNDGDLVLSPFAGVGSEGYVAIQQGRRFVGIELKEAYFNVALQNLKAAKQNQCDMFSEAS